MSGKIRSSSLMEQTNVGPATRELEKRHSGKSWMPDEDSNLD
jgi:hypothetical protein